MFILALASTPTVASPPDIQAILTNLAIFSLAVAAVVGGVYKGLRDIKFGKDQTANTGTLDEKTSHKLVDIMVLLVEVCLKIERHLDKNSERGHEVSERLRASTEEMHRLRVSVVDLHEHMRRDLR